MNRKLIIELEENDNEECVVERVLQSIKNGYVRGFYPTWYIEEDKNNEDC